MKVLHLLVSLLPSTDPAPYDPTQFATDMLSAANGALPYVGGGVAGGLVIFAVVLGIKLGLKALRTVGH
jgi:hypothetical protein